MVAKAIEQRGAHLSARSISKEERRALIQEQDHSGLTARQFAQHKGINYYTLLGWRKKERREHRIQELAAEDPIRFHEVGIEQISSHGRGGDEGQDSWPLEVTLPSGVIARGARAQELAAFVLLLNKGAGDV